ncbi:LysR family transcriptional regulator [Aliivibrio sp. S4TY2]|uniref:LysR family transcriptional regulator n=1 Tax=unclassified Aliivibrio TaxID=2645654 RepID=UPI0023786353|nr:MULTISPECIES: LysR family transcriptional regulator [unclassified Aliivibrio]MDD9155205.1 LysR family transcriptional regulator [Aliivibrio sp. S4TY2]MDD9159243.1 LysR family transcriptional regulator [Aliivibrio sp. S4TY1]MDD9163207.1 LysR family transcriptional regulator [Aliivibrio sp. S4MY2]MDD9167242.1 LysR family transcriptional regulator [Aliivibrio sp. S4MY4]MDD9184284.1 LysR family transcriptional regulator [Aliivibrio sp. S4MY3]
MFSYEHLTSFCATVEEGSYSQAARKLGKDRTTIREQIKALEDSYAIELFDIQGKKAIASPAGLAIYKQAKLLVKNSEKLNLRMMNNYQQPITQLDIFHDIIVPNSLILLVEEFITNAFPHIKIHWLHRNRDQALASLVEGKHQLAIMQNKPSNETQFPIGFLNLGTHSFSAYCNPMHPITQLSNLSLYDLQLEKQYISENHYNTMPEIFAVSTDLRLVSNNDVLLKLVRHDGWALMSKGLAQPYIDNKELIEIKIKELSNDLQIGISFFYPLTLELNDEIQQLMTFLRQYAQQHLN